MSGAGLLVGVTVLTLVLSLVLKKDAPVIAFLLVLAAGAVLLWQVGTAAQDTVRRFSALLEREIWRAVFTFRCCVSSG